MPFFEFSPSCRIHYQDDNRPSPNPVLLLHGLGANSQSWLFQIPVLSQIGFRAIAPAIPGFGRSTYPDGKAAISRFAEPIAALVEDLHIEDIDVIGISMGGTLALQLALDHPDIVSRLVLVNTFAHLNVTNLHSLPYFLSRFVLIHTLGLQSQATSVAKHLFPSPEHEFLRQGLIEQVMQSDPHAYRAAMRALAWFDVRNKLSDIHSPALIITGERDTTVGLNIQKQLAEGIPFARHIVIPDAGHAVTVEKPDIFNQVLVEFLCS